MLTILYVIGIFKRKTELTLERKPMKVCNVMKCFRVTIILRYIKECLLEPLYFILVFKCIEEHKSGINPVTVTHLVKPVHATAICKAIKEHILERSPINITNVLKPFHVTVIFKSIKEHILERSPLSIANVVKPLHTTAISTDIKKITYWREAL